MKLSTETLLEILSRIFFWITLDIKVVIKLCRHGFIVELGHKKKSKKWAKRLGCKKKNEKMKKKGISEETYTQGERQ